METAGPFGKLGRMFEAFKAALQKKGPKLCDLTAEEIAEMEEINARASDFSERTRVLDLEKQEIILFGDKWWEKIRQNHRSELRGKSSLHYSDGKVYELVQKNSGETSILEELGGE